MEVSSEQLACSNKRDRFGDFGAVFYGLDAPNLALISPIKSYI